LLLALSLASGPCEKSKVSGNTETDFQQKTYKTTTGEGMPDGALVLTTGQNLIRLQDGISCGREAERLISKCTPLQYEQHSRRSTRLKLHTIDNKLQSQSVAMLGNPRLGLAVAKDGSGLVAASVIVVGLGGVNRRE
jgi:hypothetical protein